MSGNRISTVLNNTLCTACLHTALLDIKWTLYHPSSMGEPGFLGADIYLRTQDKSTTIHEQIIANLYYVMKFFADIGIFDLRISAFIRNYMQSANIFRGSPMLSSQ